MTLRIRFVRDPDTGGTLRQQDVETQQRLRYCARFPNGTGGVVDFTVNSISASPGATLKTAELGMWDNFRRLLQLDPRRLEFRVLVERVQGLVSAVPRLFISAERHRDVVVVVLVHVHGARAQLARRADRLAHI